MKLRDLHKVRQSGGGGLGLKPEHPSPGFCTASHCGELLQPQTRNLPLESLLEAHPSGQQVTGL